MNDYELFLGDCLEHLPKLPDKSVDMVLCDLPYGTTMNKWDSVIDLGALWEQYERVCKDNAAILLFAQIPFSVTLGASNIKWLRYEYIFKKNIATGYMNANKMPLKAHEQILVFYKHLPTYNQQRRSGYENYTRSTPCYSTNYDRLMERTPTVVKDGTRCPIDVISFDMERGLHPTRKPVPLLEWLIRTYTNEGELVLDNTMGIGSTGVAAINTGRRFVGMEIDKGYYDIALQRIQEASGKGGLLRNIC